jgi:hypothetical protein
VLVLNEILIGIAGTFTTIIISFASLAYWLGKKFTQIDERIKSLEERINNTAKSLEEGINSIAKATKSQLEFFTEFLGFRKILETRDIAFVKSELSRLSTIQTKPINPLTKEEAQRMKELIEKEKLTLQEADELREIARKLVDEYGHKISETWKLLMYASIMRGIALSEQKQQ